MSISVDPFTLHFDQAFFKPGQTARWTVTFTSDAASAVSARLTAHISHLSEPVDDLIEEVTLTGGEQTVSFQWQFPAQAPRGYGLEITLGTPEGQMLAQTSAGFDVLDRWTQSPRYGFLADFEPGRSDAAAVMQTLADFHVNGLQFYDWMYRHEQFLTDEEPYIDLLGRELSRQTVNSLIDAAHQRGIAAMPYTAIYGASLEFAQAHPTWGLYDANGKLVELGTNFMGYMDPRPGTPWCDHLMAQFKEVLTQTAFDGIHLDQYGDPKVGYDAQGNSFDLAQAIADNINETRRVVDAQREDGAVIFNAVTNWPVEVVAPAGEDVVYIEVWAPYTSFTDLHTLIANAQKAGGGKPVVLAAYVHPSQTANPQLMDAIIFASSGGHIELGENAGYLADPYFPKYEALDPGQRATLHRYYDFAVRYQDVIGPRTQEATNEWQDRIQIAGFETGASLGYDKIYPLVRESPGFTAVSLVNLMGLAHGQWNEPVQAPVFQRNLTLTLNHLPAAVRQVWFASPDDPAFALQALPFTEQDGVLTVTAPALDIWDLILIEWAD